MVNITGWGTAEGYGIFLAGMGVFFWGLHYIPIAISSHKKHEKEEREEKEKK
ncbi:hypothetical protein ACFLTZ_01960 [Chloroflexota bacterium]